VQRNVAAANERHGLTGLQPSCGGISLATGGWTGAVSDKVACHEQDRSRAENHRGHGPVILPGSSCHRERTVQRMRRVARLCAPSTG